MLKKKYNLRSRGIGTNHYKGVQRGGGIAKKIGSFFSRILSKPWAKKGISLAKKGLKSVGKTALKTGGEVLSDVITKRKTAKEALKEGAEKFQGEIAEKADKTIKKMTGGKKRGKYSSRGAGKKTTNSGRKKKATASSKVSRAQTGRGKRRKVANL